MKELIEYLKCLQMYYQNCHHQAARVPFFSDHEAFGCFYNELGDHYDAIVERFIGLFGGDKIDLVQVQVNSAVKLKKSPVGKNNTIMFKNALMMEQHICSIIEKLAKGKYSQGTINSMVNIADMAEVRIYKIKQRVKK